MKEKMGEKNRMKNTDQTMKTSTLEKREKREDDSTFFYNIENLAPDGLSLARARVCARIRVTCKFPPSAPSSAYPYEIKHGFPPCPQFPILPPRFVWPCPPAGKQGRGAGRQSAPSFGTMPTQTITLAL